MLTLRCTSLAAQQGTTRMMVLLCHRLALSSSSSTTTATAVTAAATTSMMQHSHNDDDGSGARLNIHQRHHHHPHQQQLLQSQLQHPCRPRRCRHCYNNNNNNFLHSFRFSTMSSSNKNNNNYDHVDNHHDEDGSRPPPNNQQQRQRQHHPRPRIVITPGGTSSSKTKELKKIYKKRIPSQSQQQQQDRPFHDRIQLQTRGGSGGSGCISYHRIGSYKKRPCGGHGGTGGNVYLVVDPTLTSLTMPKRHYFGQDGSRGGVNGRNGKNGRHVYVRVPQGVIVRRVLDYEEETQEEEEVRMEERVLEDCSESEEGGAVGDGTALMGKGCIARQEEEGVENESDSEYEDDDDDDKKNQYFEFHSHELEENDVDHDSDSNDNDNESDDEYSEEGEDEYIHQSFNAQEEEEEDFDTQYERMLSTKRSRRRGGVAGVPSDYNDVVNQGVRAEDGMFYWSSDGSKGQMMENMDYDDNSDDSYQSRKTVFLADLDQPDSTLLVAQGGKAGVGNQAYANRPYFSNMEANAAKKAIPGMGECTYLELELKLIADVGLVGFPNAGKSSLLSAMSRAKPKIASYPFTTLHPLVGSIQYRDGCQIVMADVPGLIEGAAEGRGRGIEFLRHIERTKALVYMVDGAGVDGRDPVSDLKVLGNELREYGSSGIFGENEIGGEGEYEEEMRKRRREIMNRPSLILANKMDLIPEVDATMGRREEILFQLSQAAEEVGIACDRSDIMGISAGVTGEGLRVLSKQLRRTVLGM